MPDRAEASYCMCPFVNARTHASDLLSHIMHFLQFQYGQQQGQASQLQQQHQQFQHQVQQQLQHAHQQGQNPWYLQPNYAPHSSGLHFFGQHGGVPGALLAAANQQQFAMGHHFPTVDGNQPARQ